MASQVNRAYEVRFEMLQADDKALICEGQVER